MSYEIARRVRKSDGKIAFFWASNNVIPRDYHWSPNYTPDEIASALTGYGVQVHAQSKLGGAIRELQEKFSWRKIYEKHNQNFDDEGYREDEKANNEAFAKELEKLLNS